MSQGPHKYAKDDANQLKLSNFSFKWDNFVLKFMMVPFKNNSNKKQKQNKRLFFSKTFTFSFSFSYVHYINSFFFNFDKLMCCFKF